MNRKSLRLHGTVARTIGEAIVTGKYAPGLLLEGEVEASVSFGVSRAVYREAVRILVAKGLVHSRPRAGTRVSAQAQWHLMDPDVLNWIFSAKPDPAVLRNLFELRAIIEPAAAALAAERRTGKHLEAMRHGLDEMRKHTVHTKAGLAGDLAFHEALFAATDNEFIVSLSTGVTAAVAALNDYKERVQPLTRDPAPDHERIYDAVAAKDANGARDAMATLLRLAIADTPMQGRRTARAEKKARSKRS